MEIDIEQSNSDMSRTDPPELKNSFRRLHQFRRGNILSAHMQNVDDRFILRNHFLRMPIQNSITMMSPTLWMYKFDSSGNIVTVQVPAETLTMWDDVSFAIRNLSLCFFSIIVHV